MTDLSDREIVALRNLAMKKAGDTVSWINISDALSLTRLGLAERSQEGWTITAAGGAVLLTAKPPEEGAAHDPIPFRLV